MITYNLPIITLRFSETLGKLGFCDSDYHERNFKDFENSPYKHFVKEKKNCINIFVNFFS